MARSAKSKLAVDGSDKLAAKSKPSDKHEQADLNIEEATVASPRESKKRAGDFHDFGDEADDFADAAASGSSKKMATSKAAKPNKKAKTAPAAATHKDKKPSKAKGKANADASNEDATLEGSSKPSRTRKSKASKDEAVIEPSDDTTTVIDPATKPTGKNGKAKARKDAKGIKADESLEDRVKADAAKPPKEKKNKSIKNDVVIGPSGDTAAVEAKASKDEAVIEQSDDTTTVTDPATKPMEKAGKIKAKKDAKGTKADGSLEDRVKADAAKPPKEKKNKSIKNDVVIGPSGDTAAVEAKPEKAKASEEVSSAKDKPKTTKTMKKAATAIPNDSEASKKPRKAKANEEGSSAKDKSEPTKASKKAVPNDSEGSKKPKQAAKDKDTAEKTANPKKAEKEGTAVAKKSKGKSDTEKPTKPAKATSKKGAPKDESPAVDPDLAMDEGPFESLLDHEDSEAPKAADAGSAKAKPSKSKKGTKKAGKEAEAAEPTTLEASVQEKAARAAESLTKEAQAGAEKIKQGVETIKKGAKSKASEKTGTSADLGKAQPSKSKKRKSPDDAETVKTDILDPLSEHASTAKKQKKAKGKSLGESMGDLVNSGLETVAQGANAVRESLGALAGGAQTSIAERAPDVASGVIDAKESAKATAKKAKGKVKEVGNPLSDPVDSDTNEDSESEVDDQTAALLKGFESSADEEHPGPEDGFKVGSAIPKLPNAKETTKKIKALPASATPGVVYLGRIPHGFYEHEQRKFFSQFGDISRLRLSRNKKSGKSKHYAFIEFESEEVAKIAAESMDNYLMFGHLLKCKFIPKENAHESLWKGANKRFKTAPHNKMEKRKLELPVGRSEWADRIEGTTKKRESTIEKAKAIGYEFTAPVLKGVVSVPKKIAGSETVEELEKSLVTAGGEEGKGPVMVSEEVKTKKVKRGSKGEVEQATTTTVKKTKRTLEGAGDAASSVAKKAKKAGKNVAA